LTGPPPKKHGIYFSSQAAPRAGARNKRDFYSAAVDQVLRQPLVRKPIEQAVLPEQMSLFSLTPLTVSRPTAA
jgi:hypothetical protein